ncbi:MAG: type II and III secretion system protein family protein [Terracidiphilus sp.]
MRAKAIVTVVRFRLASIRLTRIGILSGALPLFLCACLAPVVLAAAPASEPAATFQDSTNDLYVTVGKTVLVDCARPIVRVAIGLGDVAEATAVTPTEIMVDGKVPGQTSLIIWDNLGGRQFFNVTVRPSSAITTDNLDGVRRELRIELPGQPVRINMENNHIFLRGTVKDLNDSARAVEIASTAGKVVNMLNVDVPRSEPQILLKVRFASVDRSRARQLGINFFTLGLANAVGGLTTGQFSPPSITSCTGTGGICSGPYQATISQGLNLMAYFPGLGAGATIQALETKGVVQVLAEPNLVAADGKEASFLAGGEYPYPVVQGTSAGGSTAVTIQFKEYGIRLNFIPTITPRGTIRLQVAPEVSALDYTNEVQISGFEVPGITTRSVNTEVELANGESFMIGGLLDKSISSTLEKIPFLSSIPILGKFFESTSHTKNDTELIVIVTPEIVSPIPAGTPPPHLNMPEAFMPPNSNIPMHTPDAKTPANTPPPPTMPVEKLIESMKPEQPLVIQGATGGFGTGSTTGSGAASSAPAAPPPQ